MMALQRITELSYSDSELHMIDWDVSSLPRHSHFFAPSGPPHHRYSTPLILVTSGGGTSSETVSPVFEDEVPQRPPKPSNLKLVAVNGHASSTEKLCPPHQRSLDGPQDGVFTNKDSLAHDLSFLATMPELCDVTFLVGEDRQPVCGVRAILAARSR